MQKMQSNCPRKDGWARFMGENLTRLRKRGLHQQMVAYSRKVWLHQVRRNVLQSRLRIKSTLGGFERLPANVAATIFTFQPPPLQFTPSHTDMPML